MNLYDRYVLPHVLDLACGTKAIRKQRQKVVPMARGRVLEVGVGSGLNLAHYDMARVDALIGLDPSPELRRRAERRARAAKLDVEWLGLKAEQIPLDSASIDSVVLTYTLCTIEDAASALAEIRRVLKPGGELLFSEHGQAPDASVAHLQARVTPYWRRLAGGCELNRDVPQLLRAARFELVELEACYLPKTPRMVGFTFFGRARPG